MNSELLTVHIPGQFGAARLPKVLQFVSDPFINIKEL
jgi:hypothetical protein